MEPSQKTGLKKKIVWAMVIMALLPVLLGLFVTSWKGTTELRKAIGKNFEGLAKQAASKTELAIQKEILNLTHLGEATRIQDVLEKARTRPEHAQTGPSRPDPEILSLLNQAIERTQEESILQALILTDHTGRQVAASSAAGPESSFLGNEAWWKEAAKREKHSVYIGTIYPTAPNNSDYLFDVSVPIFHTRKKEFLGVLKATYYLKPFLRPFIFEIRFGSTGHAMLIDSEGTVLICPILPTGSHVTDPLLLQSVTSDHPGWITASNDGHGGHNSIVGFAPVGAVNQFISSKAGNGWHSFIRQEPEETYAPIQSMLFTVFVSGSLLVGLTSILGFMVSGKLIQPLLVLHDGAEHIRKGDLGHRLQIKTNDEIEALADKFNEMAEKLSESHTTLEQKVQARTEELRALNQIAETVNQSLELTELLDAALEKVIEVTGFESGYIELLDSTENKLRLKSHRGFTSDQLHQFLDIFERTNLSTEVIEHRAPMIFENGSSPDRLKSKSDGPIQNPLNGTGYASLITFPVQSKNKIVGTFTLASRRSLSFTSQDLQLLSSIGNQLGTAVENAHLYQKEQDTVEKLMEMDRIKSEFLSNVSHELRTPLTSIIGFSEILLDKLVGELNGEQEAYIRNMNNSGQHLLEIINNLLDLSKIKAGKMEVHFQLFSLRTLLTTIQQTIIPMTYKKELDFEISIEDGIDTIHSDEGKIKQILLNLLGNAVKFTPPKGEVRLSVRKGWLGHSQAIEVSVQDTGIGIPEKSIRKIFDEFQQIDGSYTRDYPGTGLGLAITKRFVEILGGEISVESEAGAGSLFKILIPLLENEIAANQKPAPLPSEEAVQTPRKTPEKETQPDFSQPSTSDRERPKILVVEDDLSVAKLLALYLTREGYSVVHAYDGQTAIDKAKEIRPFAITLDIMLPQTDGWEVLKKLKALPETKEIPVIIVSIVENPTLGFSLGAVDYFTKPINRKGLIASLKKYSLTAFLKRKPMNLLVIERSQDAIEQVGSILDEAQFGVIRAHHGKEGVELAIETQPDLILLDMTLEDISAFETIHRLKQHPTAQNIPIILFASRDLSHQEKQMLDGQVREILYKGPSLKETLIQEVRKFEKLYPDKAKMIDGLTGLYNERYLHNRLSDEVNRAFRYKRTFSLILANVDRFRQINRRYGMEAGDHVLREIALVFRRNSRASNPLCRCGGSTFALLLPETTKESAKMAGEKLRKLIATHEFSIPGKRLMEGITVCIGISTFFQDANTAEKMIIQAGLALRQAQHQGGNLTITRDKVHL